MAAVYGSLADTCYQRALTANTTSTAIALPTRRTPQTRILIAGTPARTAPIHYILRAVGTETEPVTVAAGADGPCSPCVPPGMAIEVESAPSGAIELVLKSTEAGDVTVQIYEAGQ